MNYRHSFHAGNFADVVKHAILVRIIEYLKQKDKAFRIIDTHAGVGLYSLSSPEAERTGEWRQGIGRLFEEPLPNDTRQFLAPYLETVRNFNPTGNLETYPGSPALIRHLLRKQDRLTAIELHSQDAAALAENFAGDHQVRVIELDGWLAPGAHVPPKEKRGMIFSDPPFEKEGEFMRIVDAIRKAHRRWPGGIYASWYPIKDRRLLNAFHAALVECGVPDIIDIQLEIRAPSKEPELDGSGMIVVNPPFTLEQELHILLPYLGKILSEDGKPRWHIRRLALE